MGIKENVAKVKESLRDFPQVEIVAATKYMNIEQTVELVEAGIYNIAENRTDMFLEKFEALKDNPKVRWHFFGVLQTRKIKDIANRIICLHSLDKISTAIELDKKLINPLDCFIQVNISEEPNKQGIPANRVKTFIKQLESLSKIRIIGLMCIAKLTFDEEILKKSFSKMQKIRDEIEKMNIPNAPCHELSMGMSNDYQIAILYGATKVRLGRIFLE